MEHKSTGDIGTENTMKRIRSGLKHELILKHTRGMNDTERWGSERVSRAFFRFSHTSGSPISTPTTCIVAPRFSRCLIFWAAASIEPVRFPQPTRGGSPRREMRNSLRAPSSTEKSAISRSRAPMPSVMM